MSDFLRSPGTGVLREAIPHFLCLAQALTEPSFHLGLGKYWRRTARKVVVTVTAFEGRRRCADIGVRNLVVSRTVLYHRDYGREMDMAWSVCVDPSCP
jgi:hypothetical protein